MFGDERACGGGQYARARRNVECASAIAACTTGVHRSRRLPFAKMHLHGPGAHDLRQSGYFLDGFTSRTQAQRGKKCSHLRLCCLARHNLFHHCRRFALVERSAACDVRDCLSNHGLLLSFIG